MGKFAVSITRFVKKTGVSADTVVRKLGIDVFVEWLKQSPVDTGRFRANTRISVNRQDLSTDVEPPSTTPQKGVATEADASRALGSIATAKFGDTIHITNNLPYAKPLNEGHSQQAPDGIVDPVFARVKANFEKVVRSVR